MSLPSLSTDQVAAFVELSRQGTLRSAANTLHITEQGLRNRLLALERSLGVELYRKSRGIRTTTPLTASGQQFLPHALTFLNSAEQLSEMFTDRAEPRDVNVVASQYLIDYLLIDVIQHFHRANPEIRVRLSTRTEREVEQELAANPAVEFGVAAPYEADPSLQYEHLFSMNWHMIARHRHPLLESKRLRLADLVDEPLILYERGSTGRQHIMEAFQQRGIVPRVEMETTGTETIVRMVAAGLGISIVPLPSPDVVTKGHRVTNHSLGHQIRPIHSGILTRRAEQPSPAAATLMEFVRSNV